MFMLFIFEAPLLLMNDLFAHVNNHAETFSGTGYKQSENHSRVASLYGKVSITIKDV